MKYLIAVLIMIFSFSGWTKTFCDQSLNETSIQLNETEQLISYFGTLIDQNIIDLDHFKIFVEKYEQGQVYNPIKHSIVQGQLIFSDFAHQLHYQNIDQYLNSANLDKKLFSALSSQLFNEKNKIQKKRTDALTETEKPIYLMQFYRIDPGSFKEWKHTIKLTYPFEMMSTHVTQYMWSTVMGENPSLFINGPDTIEMDIQGRKIKMQPNNPVENITWWSAIIFANRLSKKEGLVPAYDISDLEFDPNTRAEDGSLKILSGKIKITKSFLDKLLRRKDNVYNTLGYRLPTYAEQRFVRADRGRFDGHLMNRLFPGVDEKNITEYAHLNAKTTTRVSQFLPFMIDEQEFYDLYGNVDEWSYDSYPFPGDFDFTTDAINPAATEEDSKKIVGRYYGFSTYSANTYTNSCPAEQRYPSLGLRLVRSLAK